MDNTSAKKILVVDDEPDVITYLEALFQDNGFEVTAAHNGKEAFMKAVSEKPDLITLDITMPEESGIRTFRDLQDHEATQEIPIVIVSGVDPNFKRFIETRKQVKPPAAYFEKPIEPDDLIAKVKEILNL